MEKRSIATKICCIFFLVVPLTLVFVYGSGLKTKFQVIFRPTSGKTRYLIYYCKGRYTHCSGWGNRLIGIMSTFLLAQGTGRQFGIMIDYPCNLTRFLVPNKIPWDIDENILKSKSLSRIHLDVRNKPSFIDNLKNINFNERYPQDVIYFVCNQDDYKQLLSNRLYKNTLAWLKLLNHPQLYRLVLRGLFDLHPEMKKRQKHFLAEARPTRKHKLVCAQVRMGKNPTIPWDNAVINSPKDVEKLWKHISVNYGKSLFKLFVTTDSEEVRKDAKKMFPKQIVDTAGNILHIDKPYRGDKCSGMAKLILDQWLLVDCDVLIVSISSYSRLSVFMRGDRGGVFLFSKGIIKPG